MRIFVFRHGAVPATAGKIFLGRTDLPLSAEGRAQAEAWKTHFAGRLPARMVSSPLCRALEFARILAGDRADAVEIQPALSEIDLGDWDGRPMAEIRGREPASWKARGEDMAGFRPPGGESFADLQHRVVPAFEKLAAASASDLLLAAHAGVNRVLLCHLLQMPLGNLFRIEQSSAGLNVIQGGAARWRVVGMNIPCPAEGF
jgi:probable phosphoglycerate mutase